MSTPFLGSLMSCAFNFAPKNYALCNGQAMAINQNQALFSLLGTTFGGNGQTTFNLPNLQAASPVSSGNGAGLSSYILGQRGGEASHTLTITEMPQHLHQLVATNATGSLSRPGGNTPGVSPAATPLYGPAGTLAPMNPAVVSNAGGNVPHENRSPFLVINWVIALNGIFPSRN